MERARQRGQVALFAIDEAHCVSQWGHDFWREYQQLKLLHERFPGIPRIALTATAEQRTREEIVAQLDLGMAARFVHSFDRPNIRYTISEGNSPRDRLWRFIDREHAGAEGIVKQHLGDVMRGDAEKRGIKLPHWQSLAVSVRYWPIVLKKSLISKTPYFQGIEMHYLHWESRLETFTEGQFFTDPWETRNCRVFQQYRPEDDLRTDSI